MVRDGFERGLRIHDDVSHELSVSLPREDVVNALFASPVEGMRYTIFGGAEKRVHKRNAMVGSESQ